MTSFLVVGDGFAAAKVAAAVASAPGTRLAALACTRPPHQAAAAGRGGVEIVAADLLAQEAGLSRVRRLGADWLLCINATVLLPAPLLALFGGGALNCHPGPLPEYAGLNAHQWAIRNGETAYGVTVHRMEARVDAGPIVAARRFPIRHDDTGLSLFRRALAEGADLLAALVGRIAAGETLPSVPQDLSRRRLYRRRDAPEGGIDWRWPADLVIRHVRAGNYEPFRSPTYVARMDTPAGCPVEVLRAEPAGPTALAPGSLVALPEQGPVVACGDGLAVRIARARDITGLLDAARWRRHFGLAASLP
ncbi:methionyl-tRNA formyltransferase [Caldovatus aquaticus]|uniref:Methionyl-tRNA formyltransferase n=1 Tax=Caldovatus aquaticus TaxID=2865671 RepID=A0ABS7EZM9_9PROT|nr:formyltransferase family protein [Caldovatus aquaticus]MBW8268684.1 hypothetical protein [Caldovatus aquaticus]